MATSVWKGFLTFGLISIPVRLFAAARSAHIPLHQLHRVCHTRLKQPLFCPTCNRVVERSEVVKGYEYEDGKYVLIEPGDLKKITPESARNMEIQAFVEASQIDPIYFDASYFVVPEEAGKKAYVLLMRALEDTERVGIAKITMHQREYTVFIRPFHKGLTLHTMYFANDIRQAPGYGITDKVEIKPQEIKLAHQLVETLSQDFHLENYHNEYRARLRQLIEAKQKGKEIAAARQLKRAPVIDMMAALKKSLAASNASSQKAPARAASEHRRRATRRAS
jgi:DNA end-binding protein Ku